MGNVSLNGGNGGGSDVVAEHTECCDSLSVVLEFRKNRDGITYRVANCIAMAEPCWEDGVNELIHPLEGMDVRVNPWQLRSCDLFDGEADEFITEVLADV